jgi:hypothetical protein
MNTYKVFYKGKTNEVKADTSLAAQKLAAQLWKVKKTWEVTVVLVALGNKEIVHVADF